MTWILIVIVALIMVGLALAAISIKKARKGADFETDYYAFFIMGICWIPLGIVFMTTGNTAFSFFFILGLVYMAIGLANKDKWKTNHKTWKQLDKGQKKVKLIIIGLLVLVLLAGIFFYFLYN